MEMLLSKKTPEARGYLEVQRNKTEMTASKNFDYVQNKCWLICCGLVFQYFDLGLERLSTKIMR